MSKESYKKWYDSNRDHARKTKREAMRRYRIANPEKHRAQSNASKAKLKNKVFDIYGRTCIGCGFSDIRALTLDHILNNGAEERKEHGERGIYRRALLPEFRHEYQTLCMNCQFIKRVEAGRQNQQWLHSHGEPSFSSFDSIAASIQTEEPKS